MRHTPFLFILVLSASTAWTQEPGDATNALDAKIQRGVMQQHAQDRAMFHGKPAASNRMINAEHRPSGEIGHKDALSNKHATREVQPPARRPASRKR